MSLTKRQMKQERPLALTAFSTAKIRVIYPRTSNRTVSTMVFVIPNAVMAQTSHQD
jgi:hypothetical protein